MSFFHSSTKHRNCMIKNGVEVSLCVIDKECLGTELELDFEPICFLFPLNMRFQKKNVLRSQKCLSSLFWVV